MASNRLREMYRASVEAFIQGDPAATKLLWSRRDDVTLANPLGKIVHRHADPITDARPIESVA
jgi:hypothetical protein